MNNICYSGGAAGADQFFGQQAAKAGHLVFHLSFPNHNCKIVETNLIKVIRLPEKTLEEADPFVTDVNENVLHRQFVPDGSYVCNLLRRNIWQIADSRAVYAVQTVLADSTVRGGTAWATHAAIRAGIEHVYVFDLDLCSWLQFDGTPDRLSWKHISEKKIKRPEGAYTGIGTTTLPDIAKDAICRLYE
jgi:hypothetical protein